MGFTLYCTQSQENRRLKAGKNGLFLINPVTLFHKSLHNHKPIFSSKNFY